MAKKKTLVLGLNMDNSITEGSHKGKVWTIAEARAAWDAGKVTDYNLALHRLATRCGWDLDVLKAQFAEMDAARRPTS